MQQQFPYLVGLDIGFGNVKSISNAFCAPFTWPSAVVSGKRPNGNAFLQQPVLDHHRLTVTTEEGTYYVGQQALQVPSKGSRRTQVRNRAQDRMSRILFQTGLALSVPHVTGEYEVVVVTGLPNDDYDLSVHTHLKEFLSKPFEVIFHLSKTQQIKKKITIKHCEILRQPEGAATFHQFAFHPEQFLIPSQNAKSYLGLIDFGHFTTDFALFREGVIVEDDIVNGSTIGVAEVYQQLKRKLIKRFDVLGYEYSPTDQDLDQAIRTKMIHYMGKNFQVEQEIVEVTKQVSQVIAKAILDAWGNETNRLECVLVSGGGAHVFKTYLEEEFAQQKKQGFVLMDHPQFSNIMGYYMYGCLILTQYYTHSEIFQIYIAPVFSKKTKENAYISK